MPDYYEIIKQPISFQKIKDRLNCLVYGCPQEVIDAVALLFRNAAQYNKVGIILKMYKCLDERTIYYLVYGSPQEVISTVALLFRNAAHYSKVDIVLKM